MKDYLIILAGSPRGGEETWNSMRKNLIPYKDRRLKGNPNKILDVGDAVLPRAPNDNYGQYNHEMRMLIDTRKIKQDYIIKVLRSKLEILKNSLNSVDKIDAELK